MYNVFYLEKNKYIVITQITFFKIKVISVDIIFFLNKKKIISVHKKISLDKNKNIRLLLPTFKHILSFKTKNTVYTLFLKLQGIGFKINCNISLLFLKVGYSHLILLFFSFFFKLEKKNKIYFNVVSFNKKLLLFFLSFLKKIKIPNIYTGKGIRTKYQFFQLRKGKVNQI